MSGSTISTSVTGPFYLNTASNPLTVTNTGTVTSTDAVKGAVYGFSGAFNVTNHGTIQSANNFGVSVNGQATISSDGVITGSGGLVHVDGGPNASGGGIALLGGGSVLNSGSIGALGAIGGGGFVGSGIFMTGAVGTVTNSGTITGQAYGVALDAGGMVTNTKSIIGGEDGVRVQNAIGTVTNSGSIIGTVDDGIGFGAGGSVTNAAGASIIGPAGGVFINGAIGTVINSGLISGDTFAGVDFAKGGTVLNNAGANITGHRGVIVFAASGSVANSGSIDGTSEFGVGLLAGGEVSNATGASISGGQFGVAIYGAAGTVTNSGTIQGTSAAGIGVRFSDSPGGVFNNTLTNSGTIIGAAAAVQFGAGNDLLKLLPSANIIGLVDGGAGINTIELATGTSVGSLTGLGTAFTNFGTLLIDAGAQWTMADSGQSDLVSIVITGFNELDTIDLTDLAFASVSGTFSNNALVLTSGTAQDTLHILGDFSSGDFRFSSDGSGGTDIQVVPATVPILTPAATPTPTPTPIPPAAPTPTPGSGHFGIIDTSKNGLTLFDDSTAYSGPVAGIQWQFINTGDDSLAITAKSPNTFIHTGSGTDAIDVSHVNGTNVLDGGTGSNFLVGGTGFDTFFVDDRSPAADVFSTVVGFHSGDNATIFGVTLTDFKLNTLDNQGAANFKGLDFGFSAAGNANANLVLTGFTTADLTNGRLTTSFGTNPATVDAPASTFMLIHAN
jgi:hypothetical protein